MTGTGPRCCKLSKLSHWLAEGTRDLHHKRRSKQFPSDHECLQLQFFIGDTYAMTCAQRTGGVFKREGRMFRLSAECPRWIQSRLNAQLARKNSGPARRPTAAFDGCGQLPPKRSFVQNLWLRCERRLRGVWRGCCLLESLP